MPPWSDLPFTQPGFAAIIITTWFSVLVTNFVIVGVLESRISCKRRFFIVVIGSDVSPSAHAVRNFGTCLRFRSKEVRRAINPEDFESSANVVKLQSPH